jgi:hypothetical protein
MMLMPQRFHSGMTKTLPKSDATTLKVIQNGSSTSYQVR